MGSSLKHIKTRETNFDSVSASFNNSNFHYHKSPAVRYLLWRAPLIHQSRYLLMASIDEQNSKLHTTANNNNEKKIISLFIFTFINGPFPFLN